VQPSATPGFAVQRGLWGPRRVPVAVKHVVLPPLDDDAAARADGTAAADAADAAARLEELQQEAAMLQALAPHPHLIRLISVFPAPPVPATVIVTALCRGGPLTEFCRREHARGGDGAARIALWRQCVRQVAAALAHLHAHIPAVVHGDVALRNVLIARLPDRRTRADPPAPPPHPDAHPGPLTAPALHAAAAVAAAAATVGETAVRASVAMAGLGMVVQLSDLGLAGALAPGMATRPALRLPVRWASPEALQTERVSCASDAWALGIVLWELCTGAARVPYGETAPDAAAVVRWVCEQRGVLAQPPECDSRTWAVAAACFAFRPEQRPSAAAVAAALS
jgi:serine/threonine protein kinase